MVVSANEGTGTTNSAVSCRMERGRVWLVGLKGILEDFNPGPDSWRPEYRTNYKSDCHNKDLITH